MHTIRYRQPEIYGISYHGGYVKSLVYEILWCSIKKLFLKISRINRKTPVTEPLFLIKVLLRPATLLNKRLWHRCFPVNFGEFLEHLSTEHLLVTASESWREEGFFLLYFFELFCWIFLYLRLQTKTIVSLLLTVQNLFYFFNFLVLIHIIVFCTTTSGYVSFHLLFPTGPVKRTSS